MRNGVYQSLAQALGLLEHFCPLFSVAQPLAIYGQSNLAYKSFQQVLLTTGYRGTDSGTQAEHTDCALPRNQRQMYTLGEGKHLGAAAGGAPPAKDTGGK